MELQIRLRGWWQDLRASLWLIPSATVLGAVVVAQVLVRAPVGDDGWLSSVVFGGTPEGARALLSAVASAAITITALSFSLTVVALQMAASQFSPRLLRTFLTDRGNQLVLSGLLATFVYCLLVLRTVRSEGDGVEVFVPQLAVSVGIALALLSVGLLVYFLHHITQQLRVDVTVQNIARDTIRQLERLETDRSQPPDREAPDPPADATPLRARRDGYLQAIDLSVLGRCAEEFGVGLRLRPTVGDWVAAGSTIAWAWAVGETAGVDRDRLERAVHAGLHVGADRTEAADLAFGLRQLEDIAAKALSPGLNDPTTAVVATAQIGRTLCALAQHPLGASLVTDAQGELRVIVPRPTFAAYLELACGQIRRYGADEPDVLIALLHMLTDVSEHVADNADRADAVVVQVDQIAAVGQAWSVDVDQARLRRAVHAVRATLQRGHRPATLTEAD